MKIISIDKMSKKARRAFYAGQRGSWNGVKPVTDWEWSLTRYHDTLAAMKEKQPEAAEAWDELEKSVVSNVADEVKISIKGFEAEMTIVKKLV